MSNRRLLSGLLVAVGLVLSCGMAAAQSATGPFPNRPIRIIVPFVPGGTIDVVTRLLARNLQESLKQPVVVDNRAGAGGVVGVDHVAKSRPDGYTLVLNAATPMVTVVSLSSAPYDIFRDLTAVARVTTFDYVLAVNAKSSIQSMQDLVQLARKDPGKLNYASAGMGSGQHMYVELLRSAAGIQIQHIPYKGNAPAMQALLSGEVDLLFDTTLGMLPMVQAGRLRPLLTSSPTPLASLPAVPTMDSLFPGSGAQGWHGVFAPAGTPREVIVQLSEAINAAVTSPDMASRLRELGLEPSALGADPFATLVRRDYERWGKLIRENNIKAD
ncbi:MAG: Bug family tripartite tricarboxylate transporter substrate binding protein [Burkholderiaceae bacterium]|jgi:tripartite-type tricarboxylate transporter receptor subunit TctC